MPFKNAAEMHDFWKKKAVKLLVGRSIVFARWTTVAENEDLGWTSSGLVIELNDGTSLLAMTDDECNGPGAIHVQQFKKYETLPVMSPEYD